MPTNFFTPDPFGPRPNFDNFPRWKERLPKFDLPPLHIKYGPATVRILIMVDGSISYDDTQGFALGIALTDAFDIAHPEHPSYARFEFVKAHRDSVPGVTAGYDTFTFTSGCLDGFDELWLFGIVGGTPYLTPAEVTVIETFMDAGGGVLAMGDHEDLGLGLCGGIKRVRSMRKWWFVSPPPPAGMEVAPDNADLSRNDTVHAPTPGANVNTGEQYDATPQTIYPNYRYRNRRYSFGSSNWVKYPHPVLCGPRGAIRVLPDHQHEGDCILPHASFAAEFPGGVGVEVVARGRNVVGREKEGFVITEPREFGLIGAWDGHEATTDDGRVLVDSTWHHWFNVNLTGLRAEDGVEYADILAYFRNCAVWLAPKTKQRRMRLAGTLVALALPTSIEQTYTLREFRPELLYQTGIFARDAVGKVASRCQSSAWLFELLSPVFPKLFLEMLDPKHLSRRADQAHDLEQQVATLALDHMGTTLLGGAINSIAMKVNRTKLADWADLHDEMDGLALEGAKKALDLSQTQLKRAAKLLSTLA